MNLSRIPVWLKRVALLLLMLTTQGCEVPYGTYSILDTTLASARIAPSQTTTLRVMLGPIERAVDEMEIYIVLPDEVQLAGSSAARVVEGECGIQPEILADVYAELLVAQTNMFCVVEVDLTSNTRGQHIIRVQSGVMLYVGDLDVHESVSTTITLEVGGQILASAAFSPAEIQPEQPSTLTFMLTNDSSINVTGVQVDLPLPAGLRLAGNRTSDCGGRFSETAGGLMLTDVTLPTRASCRITAPVTGSAGGNYTFTSSYVSANEFDYSNQATAALTILMPTPTHTPPPPVVVDQPVVSNPPISTPIPVCGNSVCEISSGENYGTCAFDCSASCGDLYCDAVLHEDASWCPSDCTP